jgi:nucleotide-binding universal stress UspA family protein/GNAT superfamily N-acetyltransferase
VRSDTSVRTGNRSRTVKLRDGSRVQLRQVRPEDKPLVADAFARLSEGSRYRRFFRDVSRLTPKTLAYLTEVDHVDHEAIIAIEPSGGHALGVARYVRLRDDPEAAEVAFAVVDDWHGWGLGRALLTHLTRRARDEGVRRFVALVQYDNQEAVKLLKGVGGVEHRAEGPEVELLIELPAKRGIGAQLARLLRAAGAGAVRGTESERASAGLSVSAAQPWQWIGTIVVGTDGSRSATVAVDAAVDLAGTFRAALHLVTAYRTPAERPDALAALAAAEMDCGRRGPTPRCHARQGEPAAVLAEVAAEQDADMIVVGSKGMTGAARLLGSVPNTVSHHAPCSVLIVRTV